MTEEEIKDLEKKANEGCKESKRKLIEGYSEGKYGFTQDPKKLVELSRKPWLDAQYCVAKGYALGEYGIEKDWQKLIELIKEFPQIDFFVCDGYAHGMFGFPKDYKKLADLSKEGFPRCSQVFRNKSAKGEITLSDLCKESEA
jgi:hypothetical protein